MYKFTIKLLLSQTKLIVIINILKSIHASRVVSFGKGELKGLSIIYVRNETKAAETVI